MAFIDRMYDEAKNDQRFRDAFININKGNRFPIFAGAVEKGVFASAYYGWLVGRYGKEHAESVRISCGGTDYN